MLSQPSSQVSLGTNPFFSALMEVPDIPSRGSTGGRGAKSLIRGRIASPSGVVPPSPEEDVMPPINVSVSHAVASLGLDSLSGSLFPPLGDSAPGRGSLGQLRDRGDSGLTKHVVSADVHSVPSSMSAFDPSSLLFPFSDSGFSSLSARPLSLPSSLFLCFFAVSSLSSTAPSSTIPIFSLPPVVPSVLSAPSVPSAALPPPSSFSQFPSALPLLASSSAPHLQPLAPPLVSSSVSTPFPLLSALPPPASVSSWLSSVPPSSSSSGFSSGLSSVSSSAPTGNFASFQARVLWLSEEYQAWGVGFSRLGVRLFRRIFPHLYSDFHLDFSSGSSHFLAALASPPPPPTPDSFLSSAFCSFCLHSSCLLFFCSLLSLCSSSGCSGLFLSSSFSSGSSFSSLFSSSGFFCCSSLSLCFGSGGSCSSFGSGLCSFSLSPFCFRFLFFLTHLVGFSSAFFLRSSFVPCFYLCLSGFFHSY